MGPDFGREAAAGVFDHDHPAPAFLAHADRDPPVLPDRFHGIFADVDEDLPHLAPVQRDQAERRFKPPPRSDR
jgi:hypothetical protein